MLLELDEDTCSDYRPRTQEDLGSLWQQVHLNIFQALPIRETAVWSGSVTSPVPLGVHSTQLIDT